MSIYEISVIALCAVILSSLLKKVSSEQGILLSIAATMLIMLVILETALPFINQIREIADSNWFDSEYFEVLIKALGITVIGQVTESICKDCCETALAYGVNMASKVAILMLSLPIIGDIFGYLSEILKI